MLSYSINFVRKSKSENNVKIVTRKENVQYRIFLDGKQTTKSPIMYDYIIACRVYDIYHLFTETEGSTVFCDNGSRGATKHTAFPKVSVNKCLV